VQVGVGIKPNQPKEEKKKKNAMLPPRKSVTIKKKGGQEEAFLDFSSQKSLISSLSFNDGGKGRRGALSFSGTSMPKKGREQSTLKKQVLT